MAKLDNFTVLKLTEPVEAAYLDVVDQLLINIAKHFKTGQGLSTAAWQTKKLAEMGALNAENAKIINRAMKDVPQEIKNALNGASKVALSDVDKLINEAIEKGVINAAPSDSVQDVIQSLMSQAVDDANLVNTVMLQSAQSAYTTIINDVAYWETAALSEAASTAAQQALNSAGLGVATGAQSRQSVISRAISKMADNGIYGFVDRAGRKWNPEAYMNMVVRTTSHNTAIESIKARQQDYNSQIFQVSTKTPARPLCRPYQGKFYSWDNSSGTFTDGKGVRHTYKPIRSTSYGEPAGLFGINCGHYPLPQIPRVTIPQDKEQLPKEENDKLYEMTQKQRALERDVREAKRKAAAFNAAGLDDAFAAQAVKVKEKKRSIHSVLQRNGANKAA